VEFVVNEVAVGQVFLPVLLFSPVSIIPPALDTHSFTTDSIHSYQLTASLNTTLKKEKDINLVYLQ
jgi:hypothetical protein